MKNWFKNKRNTYQKAAFVLAFMLPVLSFSQNEFSGNLWLKSTHFENSLKPTLIYIKGNLNKIEQYLGSHNGRYRHTFSGFHSVILPSNQIKDFVVQDFVSEFIIEGGKGEPLISESKKNTKAGKSVYYKGDNLGTYSGKDVVVGIIDTGIDFLHPDFQDSLGKTRIIKIWDHNLNSDTTHQPIYGYGEVYDSSEINSGNCPHIDPNVHYGHGTMVSGIAVGNGNSVPDTIGDFQGYAYESDILVVASDFSSNNWTQTIADGVDWIFSEADKLGKPCVINISAGTYMGSHDGQDIAARYIDSLLLEKRGRAVVCAAGNAGSQAPFHVNSNVNGDTSFTWFEVNPSSAFGIPAMFIEAWGDTTNMKQLSFSLSLTDTTTWTDSIYVSDLIINRLDSQYIFPIVGGGNLIIWIGSNLGQYQFQALVTNPPANSFLKLATWGIGEYDAWGASWLGISNIVNSNLPNSTQYPQITNYQRPDSLQSIVSSWNCSPLVISVGNYNNRFEYENIDGGTRQTVDLPIGGIGSTSSRGPNRTGYLKPDVSAPGNFTVTTGRIIDVNYLANTPSQRYKLAKGGYHFSNGGTSMASPVIAGLVARYLEKCPNSNYIGIKESLTQTAFVDSFTGAVPNYRFGAGKVDAVDFMEHSNEYDTLVSWPSHFAFCEYDSISISVSQPQINSVIYWSIGDSTQSIMIDSANHSMPIKAWFVGPKGCLGYTDTSYTSIYKAPEIILSADSAFCPGTTDSIQVASNDSTTTWVWNTGETSSLIVIYDPGTFSVKATSIKGCVNSDSIRVDTFESPRIEILSDSVFCLEDGDTLYSSSIDTNIKWSWNSGDTSNYLLIDSSGTYSLEGKNMFGCTSADTVEIKGVLCYVTLNENEYAQDIRVYPNPTSDVLNVVGGSTEIEEIDLYNNQGQLILNRKTDSNSIRIDLSNLQKGTYYLRSKTDKGMAVAKIWIVR
ncbi:MAG: S8/S53 family peptidase [Salibacteraceae bacterium]